MSWKDTLENSTFSILCGDGQLYKPLWKPQNKDFDFNTSSFDYIDVEGTFIDRKKSKGEKMPLSFWFQGDDCLEVSKKFETSSKDQRYWIVYHPYYGTVKGQPLSIGRNDDSYGIVYFEVDFWESIITISPKKSNSLKDDINLKSIGIKDSSSKIYASKSTPNSSDVSNVKSNLGKMSVSIGKVAESKDVGEDSYSNFNQLKAKSFSFVDNMVKDPISGISSINDLLSSPSDYNISVENRTNLYNILYNQLKENLGLNDNKENKSYFESTASTLISYFSKSLVNPTEGDYRSRNEVIIASESLKFLYKDYLNTLESLQEDLNSVDNYFISDGSLQNEVQFVVLQTISKLFDLAFEAKQERVVYLKEDSNIFLLVHKYLGLDSEDKNLNDFRFMNNIKNKKLLNIKKGTKIIYLV